MSEEEISTVWVLTTSDISTAPGTTEPYYLVRKFAKCWETHVFAPLSKPIEPVEEHWIPFTSLPAVIFFNIAFTPYFSWCLIRHPPDLVYVYQNIFTPVFIAEFLTNTTIVYDIRSDPYAQPKEFGENKRFKIKSNRLLLRITYELHRIALPRADGVVTLSEPLANNLCIDYGVARKKIEIIPLAADPDEFEPKNCHNDLIKIVYIGTIRKFRGIDSLVHALAALDPDLRSNVQLELFGGADEKYIQTLRDTARNGPRINWHGHVDHEEMSRQVATCDIAASPLPALDSFKVSSPAKIYEYLALGLPIIATDIIPHRRILTENCSLLVPPDDTEAMMESFEYLITKPEYRSRLSTGARKKALNNTWTDRFEKLRDFLRDI